LGTGQLEKKLVSTLKGSSAKEITVLLDHCRGTRRNAEGESSCSILKPLAATSGRSIAFYHTPALRGVRKWLFPERLDEFYV